MFAIFKRELRSYFTSLVGYVVIGVMLAFTGLYYSANCLVYGTSDFSTVLYSTTLVGFIAAFIRKAAHGQRRQQKQHDQRGRIQNG